MINSRTLVAIFASLAFALAFASCEQATDPGPQPTPPTPIDKELAGIQFLSEAGYTQEEIDAIAAELLALYDNNDLAGLSEYVKSLTFRPGADGRAISLVGADGEQVATIITNSAGRVEILGDLTAGRDAAYDARNPYIPTPGPDYIDTKIGGIEFITADVEFSEEQVAAIQAQLDTLDEAAVAGFAQYVERVTFGQGVEDGLVIDVNEDAGEDATAVIYIEYDATAAEIMAALTAAQAKTRDVHDAARDTDTGPTAFHVFTDGAGNELSFFAEAGFDYTAALTWVNHPMSQDLLLAVSPYVASLTFKLNVEGNRQTRLDEDGRAVVITDSGTFVSIEADLAEGFMVGNGWSLPTHTMMQAIRAQMANIR